MSFKAQLFQKPFWVSYPPPTPALDKCPPEFYQSVILPPPSTYCEYIESLCSQSHYLDVNSSSQVELRHLYMSSVIHLALKQFIMWNLKIHT